MKNCLKFFVLVISLVISNSAIAEKIKKIEIKGNQRVEKETILEYLTLERNQELTELRKSTAVKKLYATTLFDDIKLSINNGNLLVWVKETPFISKIEFKGNSKLKSAMIERELMISVGESLKTSFVETDVQKIKAIYKTMGRFSATVEAKIEKQENNRVKVVFNISEGPKTGIKSIYFVGNKNYSSSELRSRILTKESRWFRFLGGNDTYNPEKIEHDKYLLTQFYKSVGFAAFRVLSVSADLTPTKDGFVLTYAIEEGDKFNFGDFSINNKLSKVNSNSLDKFIKNYKGKIFNTSKTEEIAENITKFLSNNGFPDANVTPKYNTNVDLGVVDVVFKISAADKIYLNKINISGNVKTREPVIRRQLNIQEGDLFNRSKIQQADRNIRNLDYFATLMVKPKVTKRKDRYDLNIEVEEKSTASIALEAGYDTSSGPFGQISFVERNLVGSGKALNISTRIGKKNAHYQLGITDPHFLDRDLSFGWNAYHIQSGEDKGFGAAKKSAENNYGKSLYGLSLSAGYEIAEDFDHQVIYSYEKENIRSSASKSISIADEVGKFTSSAIAHTVSYDQLDNRHLPKNGYLLSATQKYSGIGGNVKYIKHDLEGNYVKSFMSNQLTMKLKASVGHINGVGGKKIRVSDRINLGDHSFRGFASGGIGPREIKTEEGLGGQKYYKFTAELDFPLGVPKEFDVTGSVFLDAGTLWDADVKPEKKKEIHNDKALRASIGFGVLWVTRIAPIRVDFGFPIVKKKYDETQNFHLKFSTSL